MTAPANNADYFAGLADMALDFLGLRQPAPADPDVRNPRDVYAHLAALVSQRLDCPPPAALAVVHRLCGERTAALLADATVACDPTLLERANSLIVRVEVHFVVPNSRAVERVTVIQYVADDPVGGGLPDALTERRISERLDWEVLPGEVRNAHWRAGAAQLSFRLYPPDSES